MTNQSLLTALMPAAYSWLFRSLIKVVVGPPMWARHGCVSACVCLSLAYEWFMLFSSQLLGCIWLGEVWVWPNGGATWQLQMFSFCICTAHQKQQPVPPLGLCHLGENLTTASHQPAGALWGKKQRISKLYFFIFSKSRGTVHNWLVSIDTHIHVKSQSTQGGYFMACLSYLPFDTFFIHLDWRFSSFISCDMCPGFSLSAMRNR